MQNSLTGLWIFNLMFTITRCWSNVLGTGLKKALVSVGRRTYIFVNLNIIDPKLLDGVAITVRHQRSKLLSGSSFQWGSLLCSR